MAKNQVVVSLVAENQKLNQALGQSTKEIKKLEKQLERARKSGHGSFDGVKKSALGSIGPLAGLGAAFGGVSAATDFIGDSVSSTLNLATATKKLSRETGMDAQTASAWVSIAKERGISTQRLTLSFGGLSRQLAAASSGSKTAASAFKSVGVSTDLIAKGDTSAVLGRISDSFQRMKDGPQKTALSMRLFGRSGRDLLPILNQGSAGVKKLQEEMKKAGVTMGGTAVADAMKLKAAQRDLNTQVEGLKVKLGTALLPALSKAAKGLTNFVQQAIAGKGAGAIFKDAVVSIAKAVKELAKDLGPIIKKIADFANKHPEIVKFALAFAVVALAGLKLAKAISTISAAVTVLEAVMAPLTIEMLPVIAVILIIAGLAYLIYRNWKPIKKFFIDLWGHVKSFTISAWNHIKGFFVSTWSHLKTMFHSAGKTISDLAKKGFLGPVPWIIAHWGKVVSFFKSLPGKVVGFVTSMPGRLRSLAGKFADAGLSLGKSFINSIGKGIKGLGSFLGDLGNSIRNWINEKTPFGDDIHLGPIKVHIPKLAKGAIVNGGQLAVIGEDGPEAVIPLGAKHRATGAALYQRAGMLMGMSNGNTFNVYNYGGNVDEGELAARMAWQMKTRASFA